MRILSVGPVLLLLFATCCPAPADDPVRPRRLIYNSDADNMFIYAQPPMQPEDVDPYVDEVAASGATTLYMCPNYGMPVTYPSRVTQMFGTGLTPEQQAQVDQVSQERPSLERGAANLHSLVAAGHSPVGLVIDRARERGLETFITFRPNEVHWVEKPDEFPISLLLSEFWQKNPQWRIGRAGDSLSQVYLDILGPRTSPVVAGWLPGGMNFAVPEVRAQRLAQMKECCESFDIDGLDIDFQRFPMYFPVGKEEDHIDTMTAWIREIRSMMDAVGRQRGRRLLLSVRIMARPDQNRQIGLDPIRWAGEGLVDIVVASHYLHNNFPLPIAEYRKLLPPEMPLYGSIEVEKDADDYRRIARHLWDDGADGILMFNFFTCRQRGVEPEFALLRELGNPAALKPVD